MEHESNTPYEHVTEAILLCARKGILKKAVLSKSDEKKYIRTNLSLKTIGGRSCIQSETFRCDNKALHKNMPLDADDTKENLLRLVENYAQINLMTVYGDGEVRRSKGGKITVSGISSILERAEKLPDSEAPAEDNNRKKAYILDGSEKFLRLLGISDATGRVYDKKQAKFRQINRFLEHIRDIYGHLPQKGELFVLDLCCGKSYLSFAVYHYLSDILGRRVTMHGVDLKSDVTEYCSKAAKDMGFDGLEFFCMDIEKYVPPMHPHLVLSLHACDIATDIVIDKAISEGADVILSTPCCHHELNHMLDCPTLEFIGRYSMLRQKLCDAATDSLRLMRMEMNGYATDALELIDPDDTPKNILLRGIRKKNFDKNSERAARLADEYRKTYRFLYGKNNEGSHGHI